MVACLVIGWVDLGDANVRTEVHPLVAGGIDDF